MMKVHGRVALVTGASSGIGRATALALARAGFVTVATARDVRALAELAAHGCHMQALDVADEVSLRHAVDAVESRFGPVYALINSAGVPLYGPLEEVPLVAVRRMFEVNVFGLARLCQLVLPGMRRAGVGRIINVSALAGTLSQPGGGYYHASKHALEVLTETLRMEVQGFGVDVVGIVPSPVGSRFEQKAVASIPQGGTASPYHAFKESLANELETRSERALAADDVARVIVRAACASRPRLRYRVGRSAKIVLLLRGLLSERAWQAMMTNRLPTEEV